MARESDLPDFTPAKSIVTTPPAVRELQATDAVEAIGIFPCDAAPEHLRVPTAD